MTEKQQNNFDFIGKSKELRLLTDSLDKGIEISSKEQFDKIVLMLKENNLTDLSKNTFDSIIGNGKTFVIKKSNNGLNIYGKNDNFISRNFRKYSNNFRLIGIISNGDTFKSLVGDDIYEEDENNLGEKLISKIEQIRSESKSRLQSLKEEIVEDEPYIIQKKDTLWKIVKEKYGLTKNRDIANAVNALVEYNKNVKSLKNDDNPDGGDGIKGDKIIIGKIIKLPPKLKIYGDVELNRK
ncbi:MAG: hypothetical protein PHV23_03500 [Candidatus Gracilibacteria bacterium]|nr:hypothetical protein [Candidatus Gracilibacteria bacterium]